MRVQRLTLRLEDAAVGLEQVAALHPLGAGAGTDQQRDVDCVEGLVRVVVMSIPDSSGNAQSSSSIAVPSAALTAVRDLEQRQVNLGIGTEQLAAGDPEQDRVADLAGRAGDGYSYGAITHVVHLLDHRAGTTRPAAGFASF